MNPHQNIDEIMSTAANSMQLPVLVAQMFMQVGAELSRLRTEAADLRETISNQYQRHSNQIADLRKQIDKLSGVHGA